MRVTPAPWRAAEAGSAQTMGTERRGRALPRCSPEREAEPERRQTDDPTVLRIVLIWVPRNCMATTTTIAMSAKINTYSTRPWPFSRQEHRS